MNVNTLKTGIEEWITIQKVDEELAANTLKVYKNAVNRLVSYFEENKVNIVSKEELLKYKAELKETCSSTDSANTYIVAINKYFRYLDHKELCLKQYRIQNTFANEKTINKKEYKRMLYQAKKHKLHKIYLVIKTIVMTGIRFGELKFFTVETISNFEITVFNKAKERTVPIRQDLKRELLNYAKANNIISGPIFLGNNGKPLNPATAWKQMQKVGGYAKVNKKKVHAHSFRHLFAQLFLEENPGNYLDLADMLGHAKLDTTRKYTKLSNEEKRKRLEKIKF